MKLHASVSKQVKQLSKSHALTPLIQRSKVAEKNDEEGEAINYDDDAEFEKLKKKKNDEGLYEEGDEEDQRINKEIEESEKSDLEFDDENADDKLRNQSDSSSASESESEVESHKSEMEDDEMIDAGLTSDTLRKCPYIRNIRFSVKDSWCECVISLPLAVPKLLVMSMVESILDSVLLRQTAGIQRCFVVEKREGGRTELVLQTDGVNFQALSSYGHVFDLSKIYSNDIAAILRNYGVEAARACIAKEITAVFNVYGISVNQRHLSLIADYMTFHGDYKALNRGGIDSSASPFQKISFETSINFLKEACLRGDIDALTSPSSRIVLGKPVASGTGCFDLLAKLIK